MNCKTSLIAAALAAVSLAASAAVSDFTVNGEKVTAAAQEKLLEQAVAQGAQRTPQLEEAARRQLTAQAVLLQEAKKQNLEKDPVVAETIAQARDEILSRGVLAKYLANNPVTDAEVQKVYNERKAAYGPTEYHVRHILVETEDAANKVIDRLKKGEDFAKVAKDVSIDQGTKEMGGDLDWASPESMVKPFGDAMRSQKKGAYSAKPVKSEFGYHVLEVLDTRPAELFPSIDRMKADIEQQLTRDKANSYLEGLISKATVK